MNEVDFMKKQKGLTLIELLVSLALIGILAVTFLPMFSAGFANIVRAGLRTKAVNIAEADMINQEEIAATDSYTINIILNSSKKNETAKNVGVNGSLFTGKVTINEGQRFELDVEVFEFKPQ